MYVVVVIRYFSDEIKYAIVFVFSNSIFIKFLFPKAHGVRVYRQLFLAGDIVILNTNWEFVNLTVREECYGLFTRF